MDLKQILEIFQMELIEEVLVLVLQELYLLEEKNQMEVIQTLLIFLQQQKLVMRQTLVI